MAGWEEACDHYNAKLANVAPIKAVADTLRVKPLVVVVVGSFFGLGFVLYGFGGELICAFAGFAYPAYESFKAIDAHQQSAKQAAAKMQFWLTYWVVFAALVLTEWLYYWVVVWFPFYYPLKLCLLVWLWLPNTRGAEHVYRWLVAPVLHKNRRQIDDAIDKAARETRKTLTTASISGAISATSAVAKDGLVQLHRSMSAPVHLQEEAKPEGLPQVPAGNSEPQRSGDESTGAVQADSADVKDLGVEAPLKDEKPWETSTEVKED
mmetsp:Transcript_33918/g.59866  ORF Transcript_33918/g.59866 Transcript_33918/m.59866 type:complete len:265 (-) Transcript_33918:46-840(-)